MATSYIASHCTAFWSIDNFQRGWDTTALDLQKHSSNRSCRTQHVCTEYRPRAVCTEYRAVEMFHRQPERSKRSSRDNDVTNEASRSGTDGDSQYNWHLWDYTWDALIERKTRNRINGFSWVRTYLSRWNITRAYLRAITRRRSFNSAGQFFCL